MSRDSGMYEFASTVVNDKKHVQRLKPSGLNGEEITCPDLRAILSQELAPTGRVRSTVWTPHVPGDSTCTNPKTKTCQFRLDSALYPKGRLRAPHKGILASHTADEFPEFGGNLFASGSRPAT